MIHYHGTPITPRSVAINVLSRRHACVSYAHTEQVGIAFEVCQSVILDNGAFSLWKSTLGQKVNVALYAAWVRRWWKHPGFDFCFIPDVIDGSEAENEAMFAEWHLAGMPLCDERCVPVWHMHESLERLDRLCRQYPRVALGSSGQWATVGTADWWERMSQAMPPQGSEAYSRTVTHLINKGWPPAGMETFGLRPLAGNIASWPQTDEYAMHAWWSRGFIRAVRLPTATWLQHRVELVRNHPIQRVELTDREPRPAGRGGFNWHVCGTCDESERSVIRRVLVSGGDVGGLFPTEEQALDWLSERLIARAKELAKEAARDQ